MEPIIKSLLSQGTIAALFIASLLVFVVVFTKWAIKLLDEQKEMNAAQLKIKDARIEKLEGEMKEIQNYVKNELHDTIVATQKIMVQINDNFIRMEKYFNNIN